MFPPFAQAKPGTEAIIDIAARNGVPILSYDHYIMMADGTTRDQAHFEYLQLFRRKSLEYDLPFWAFALTTEHYRYRRPSESDVRFKQFTNLAYGAKGLWYFTYWGPTDWQQWDDLAIVNPADGSPTELYNVVKDINEAVLEVGDVLLDLKSTEVVHTNPPEGAHGFRKDEHWISDITAKDALIGFYKDSEGIDYAMIVNKLHGAGLTSDETADDVVITLSPEVESVEILSWLDGDESIQPMTNNVMHMRIGGGTGVLIRVSIKNGETPGPIACVTDSRSTENP
jgi:hypothetical protein